MKLSIDSEARSGLIRILLFSLCLATIGAIVLSTVSLLLPSVWLAKGLTFIGLLVGLIVAVLLYSVWGSASCLADIDVWGTACLVALGSIVIQSVFCMLLSELIGGWVLEAFSVCTPSDRYAAMYGNILTVLAGTLPIWVAVRYLTWKIRRGSA